MGDDLAKRLSRENAATRAAREASGTPASLVLLPPESHPETADLIDLAYTLNGEAKSLGANLPGTVRAAIGDLVRGMNCYYSNLIEGRITYPVDIDRALRRDFSAPSDAKKRDLQLEASAHIEVQRLIDSGGFDHIESDTDLIKRIHKEFYDRLPEDLHWNIDPDTGRREPVVPGELRSGGVVVGGHHAVDPIMLNGFMQHFAWGYAKTRVRVHMAPIAAVAAHHRLLWIHPFTDGNGRVARLHTHALFRRWAIGSELWSISRGFARTRQRYYDALARADYPRQGQSDGRGTLSDDGLVQFCRYALETAIDQVRFMRDLVDPAALIARTRDFVAVEERRRAAKEVRPQGAEYLRAEALPFLERLYLLGEVPRGEVQQIIGTSASTASRIIRPLAQRHLIVSDDDKAPWRPAFPMEDVGILFPNLLPPNLPTHDDADDEDDTANPSPTPR
jgi:Fic family protein